MVIQTSHVSERVCQCMLSCLSLCSWLALKLSLLRIWQVFLSHLEARQKKSVPEPSCSVCKLEPTSTEMSQLKYTPLNPQICDVAGVL